MVFRLQYWLVLLLGGVGRWVPRRLWLATGRGLGGLIYRLHGRHRGRALRNVGQALGDSVPTAEVDRIARDAFRHLGGLVFESVALAWRPKGFIAALVDIEGSEHYQAAKARGRGVIALSGHFGNWEIMALAHALAQGPVHVVGRAPDNPYLARFMERIRTRVGNEVIYKSGALRQMLRVLGAGETVAFLIDQDIRQGDREFVEFFGRKAATTRVPAWFAVKHGVQLLPVYCLPTSDGRYRSVYEPAIDLAPTEGMTQAEAIRWVTQRYTQVFERQVRRRPECWMWMQRRWSSRPPEEIARLLEIAGDPNALARE